MNPDPAAWQGAATTSPIESYKCYYTEPASTSDEAGEVQNPTEIRYSGRPENPGNPNIPFMYAE
jgi:hypothetical protein